jgi:hypothetical protein
MKHSLPKTITALVVISILAIWIKNSTGRRPLMAHAVGVLPTATIQKTAVVSEAPAVVKPHRSVTFVPVETVVVEKRYDFILKGINLSDSKKDALLALLTKKENVLARVRAELSDGNDLGPMEIFNSVNSANGEITDIYADLSNSIGADKYNAFRSLESTLPALATVTAVSEKLGSDDQLTQEKTEKLVALLDPPHPRIAGVDSIDIILLSKNQFGGMAAGIDLQSHQSALISPQVLVDAESFLSPTELDALRAVRGH